MFFWNFVFRTVKSLPGYACKKLKVQFLFLVALTDLLTIAQCPYML